MSASLTTISFTHSSNNLWLLFDITLHQIYWHIILTVFLNRAMLNKGLVHGIPFSGVQLSFPWMKNLLLC